MPKKTLDEESLLGRSGIADRTFGDHSGNIQQGYEYGSLTRGLAAYYPMEEGQGQVLRDASTDATGQIDGASWVTGKIGSGALSFNGTSDKVTMPYSPISGQEFTMSIWVKYNSINNTNNQHTFRVASTDPAHIEETGGNWQFRIYDGSGSVNYSVSATASTGSWAHLVGVFNSGELSFYVDGAKVGSTASGITFDGSVSGDPSSIGARFNDKEFHDGDTDDARIYDRALSQPEIEALYNVTQPHGTLIEERDVPTKTPDYDYSALARYAFNGDVTDSWNEYDGTNNGVTFVDGVYGQAGSFGGTSDYVDIEDEGDFDNLSELTVSCWLNSDSFAERKRFVSKDGNAGAYDQFVLYYNFSNDTFQFYLNDGNTASGLNVGRSPSTGEWFHLIGTWDGSTRRIYVNGKLAGEDSYSSRGLGDTANPLTIGCRGAGLANFYDGDMDDVRIYEKALTPIEVETLFNKGSYRINRGDVV